MERIVDYKQYIVMWLDLEDVVKTCTDYMLEIEIKPKLKFWTQYSCNNWMQIEDKLEKWCKKRKE